MSSRRRVIFLDDADRAAVGGFELGLWVDTQLVIEHRGQVGGRDRALDRRVALASVLPRTKPPGMPAPKIRTELARP